MQDFILYVHSVHIRAARDSDTDPAGICGVAEAWSSSGLKKAVLRFSVRRF
jgi:hypothetical protein